MKIEKKLYSYQEYLTEYIEDSNRICFISGIKKIDRSNKKVFMKLFEKYKPHMTFVIYDDESLIIDNIETVKYYQNDKRGNAVFVRTLLEYLLEKKGDIDKCIVDASAINKETLLEVMYILEQFVNVKIDIIYLTPKEYGDYQYDSYKTPYSISFTPGIQLMEKKNILILLSGYEEMGEIALIRYIEPTILFIGDAKPSSEEQFFSKNIENKQKVIEEFSKYEGIEIKDFHCSGNDIAQCTEDILKLFEENGGFINCNLFIAPMNNKLTTLAVFNTWKHNPNIQIVDIRGTKKVGTKDESGIGSVYHFKYERDSMH